MLLIKSGQCERTPFSNKRCDAYDDEMAPPFTSEPFSWPEDSQHGFSREFDGRRVLPVLPGILPAELVQAVPVVPFAHDGNRLVVAVLESFPDEFVDKIRFIANKELKIVVVSAEAMDYAVQRYVLKK